MSSSVSTCSGVGGAWKPSRTTARAGDDDLPVFPVARDGRSAERPLRALIVIDRPASVPTRHRPSSGRCTRPRQEALLSDVEASIATIPHGGSAGTLSTGMSRRP